jgi:hypothetical protein
MKKFLFASIVSLFCMHANAGFLLGYMLGNATSSNNSSSGTSDATVIYIAPEEVMKAVTNPLSVKQVNKHVCPYFTEYGTEKGQAGLSLSQIFTWATTGMPASQKTILQISRVIDPQNISCATFWFSYVDK